MKETDQEKHQRKYIADIAKKGAVIKNHGAMCGTCAFKEGSEANLEPHNVQDAAECVIFGQNQFNCNKSLGVDAGVLCKGFLNAQEYIKSQEQKPRK